MGSSNWSSQAYQNFSRTTHNKSTDQIFRQNVTKQVASDMSPKGITVREARDSANHPESLAVLVFLDETGSMGEIPGILVREKLGALMDTLVTHGVKDAAVLFGGIGDTHSDSSPLQVGQFESGTDELVKWLSSLYLEGNGGGQGREDYLLAWLLAARHTSIDCFDKRKQKGILFTIGDEMCWQSVDGATLKDLLGYAEATTITDKEILAEAQRMYHVFHIHIEHAGHDQTLINSWRDLLGERLIILKDYNQVAELIATTVAVIHGVDINAVTAGFDSKTASDVKNALVHVNTDIVKAQDGVITL